MAEIYNTIALHFDKQKIPQILRTSLKHQTSSLADLGCGDGPWFKILYDEGYISPDKPVYAVDLEPMRIVRIHQRFPWITAFICSADDVPQIASESIEFAISTMVLEHVPDELRYLQEIYRISTPHGKAYLVTVFKRKWAWYFRKRNGESVLDTSHLREYSDMSIFNTLIKQSGLRILELELKPLWFPLLDPILFRVGKTLKPNNRLLKIIRSVKVPIFGYYELHSILAKC